MKFFAHYYDRWLVRFILEPSPALPLWPADQPHPPLPPRQAMEISQRAIPLLIPGGGALNPKFSHISLKPLAGEHWYYLVSWSLAPPSPQDMAPFEIPVLMDGNIPPHQRFHYDQRHLAWGDV
ncbi:MAG: hypothetical protein MI747_11495 [Desulfobacterales bacterium]|nr:hypothetical protein [Desulfobacterales bacterium]